MFESLSSRRAWIEMVSTENSYALYVSRSPHGERGLKYTRRKATTRTPSRRSPHGERGLKSIELSQGATASMSLSSRRAWIEIPSMRRSAWTTRRRSPHGERGLKLQCGERGVEHRRSLSSRRAWIEMRNTLARAVSGASLSSRRAWIEILVSMSCR